MYTESRIRALDSIRGISAMIVVVFHCLISFPAFYNAFYFRRFENGFIRLLTASPLHILGAGPEAVIMFFVLSGFVLALPFLSERAPALSYGRYAVRRICRIYMPYVIVMMLYVIVIGSLSDYRTIDALSPTFNARWAHPVTPGALVSYVLMLDYDAGNVNGVIWSLIHEMRISLIFPLIIYFVKRLDWKISLATGLFICLGINIDMTALAPRYLGGHTAAAASSFAATVYYIPFFIMGAILAKYRFSVTARLKGRHPAAKAVLFIAALELIVFKWIFYDILLHAAHLPPKLLGAAEDWITGAGVALLFSVVLSSERADRLLTRRFFSWLGKISYSIYLVHVMVIMICARYLSGVIPLRAAILLSPVLTLPAAWLVHKYIEQPAVYLGKRLSDMKRLKSSSA